MTVQLTKFLRTGHPRIDAAHALIMDQINALRSAIDDSIEVATLHALIEQFVTSCADHFFEEERILLDLGYPQVTEHAVYHSKILHAAQDALKQCMAANDHGTRAQHVNDIISFLIDDIVRSDLIFAPFLETHGIRK